MTVREIHKIFLLAANRSHKTPKTSLGPMRNKSPNRSKISQKCSLLATLNGLTQAELARRLEIKPSNLNHYLRGRGDVHSELFVRILKEFGLDIEDLINRELARLNGLNLEEKITPGIAMEAVAKALPREDRQAMVSFIVKMAQVNLGARAKTHARILKSWVQ